MIRQPSCLFCKHLHDGTQAKCDAFPGGIPEVIFLGKNQHFKPFPGDNGIQFDPLPQFKEQYREIQRRQSPKPE